MPVLLFSVSNFQRISNVFLGGWDRCLGWALFLCPPRWMEACLEEELPPTTELEEGLRNGVFLGKLATFFAPKMVSEKRIYDRDQSRYKVCVCVRVLVFWLTCSTQSVMSYSCFYLQSSGLHFRHTDNTVQWLRAMESVGLPKVGGFGDASSLLYWPVQMLGTRDHLTQDL